MTFTQCLMTSRAKEVFDQRNTDAIGNNGDWFRQKLPHYDDAYSFDVPLRSSFVSNSTGVGFSPIRRKTEDLGLLFRSHATDDVKVDERSLRHGFLAFFVAVLKNYRRYLVYASRERPSPLAAFRNEAFIADHPSSWQPFLISLVQSQAFSQFVDERVGRIQTGEQKGFQLNDLIFFDESIDAKMNRYSFSLSFKDTPFLSSTADVHAKSYVPPSPDTSEIDSDKTFRYDRFPSLLTTNFAHNTGIKINFAFESTAKGQALAAAASQARLKRTNSYSPVDDLTIASCHFSSYLTVLAHRIVQSESPITLAAKRSAYEIEKQVAMFHGSPIKLNSEKPHIDLSHVSSNEYYRDGAASVLSSRTALPELSAEEEAKSFSARRLALKVALESLNCLTRMNDSPDEISFRFVHQKYFQSYQSNAGTSSMHVQNVASHAAPSR